MSRRAFLVRWGSGLGALVALSVVGSAVAVPEAAEPRQTGPGRLPPAAGRRNPIATENARPGTRAWQSPALEHSRGWPFSGADPDSGADPQTQVWADTAIRGYADRTSVDRGGAIRFHVGTARPRYDLEVYRMGWYGGTGARLVTAARGLAGQAPPVPTPDAATGLAACAWPAAYTLQTGADWVSGAYLAKLVADDGSVGYVPFVVRADGDPADVAYVLPVTTYQAYNNWGGKSLYDYNSTGGRAHKVSFDRPYAGSGTGYFFTGDYNMIRWLEAQGYDVTYASSLDLHADSGLLGGRRAFLSNWHDEYWSRPMRANLTAARDRGLHLAFFGANNVYWQVRLEPSAAGVAGRVLVCYKDAALDPLTGSSPGLATVLWRDPPVNEPENALLGVMYEGGFNWGMSYPWVVRNAGHWVYEGTGLADGQQVAGLVGYEYDRVWDNGRTPGGLTTLSASPVVRVGGVAGTANGAVHTAPSGAIVFCAGTNYWPWKLDDNAYQAHGADARVRRMTANLLGAMGCQPASTPPPPPAERSLAIYADALAAGWANWSWGSTVNLAGTSPVYAGTRAISFTATSAYAGLSLRTGAAVDTAPYTHLRFAARASQAGQRYSVYLIGAADQQLRAPQPLLSYGGDPVADAWKVYSIPLADLNGAGAQVKGVVVHEWLGRAQPALYVDELAFVGPSAAPTATAGPTQTPTPSPPVSTSTPTAPAVPTATATTPPTATAVPTVTATVAPSGPPAAPSNLRGKVARGARKVNLTWADKAVNEASYEVERSADGTTFARVATLGPNTTTYTDSVGVSGSYAYRVRAANAAGPSSYSNIATVLVP